MKKTRLAALVAGSALVLAACSGSGTTHQSSQAGATDHSAAQVLQMPSGFRNVALKCAVLRGQGFAVLSASDGGNNDNLPASVAITPDSKCLTDGP